MRPTLTFLIGCTASGKGSLGRLLASRTGGEIISLDSMKVYRGMDIGTAKPSPDARAEVPHHLIDVVEPWEEFTVARFVELADQAIAGIHERGRPIFAVGGTPLYLKILTEGMFEGPGADPELRDRLRREADVDDGAALHQRLGAVDPASSRRIHPNDLRRIIRALEVFELTGVPISTLQAQWDQQRQRYDCVLIGLHRSREDQSRRIRDRVARMFDAGLVDEVRALLDSPNPLSATARKAVGYAEVIEHLRGECTLEQAVERIKINTRRLAKAQRTWLRRFVLTRRIDLQPDSRAEDVADALMREFGALWSPSPK